MREAFIYALAMGILAFGGGASDRPLPVPGAASCSVDCPVAGN